MYRHGVCLDCGCAEVPCECTDKAKYHNPRLGLVAIELPDPPVRAVEESKNKKYVVGVLVENQVTAVEVRDRPPWLSPVVPGGVVLYEASGDSQNSAAFTAAVAYTGLFPELARKFPVEIPKPR